MFSASRRPRTVAIIGALMRIAPIVFVLALTAVFFVAMKANRAAWAIC